MKREDDGDRYRKDDEKIAEDVIVSHTKYRKESGVRGKEMHAEQFEQLTFHPSRFTSAGRRIPQHEQRDKVKVLVVE
jgi:hypothetical protein